MAENSKIAWTDHTFNPWIGCTKVSEGCKFCYAEHDTFARKERSHGRELWGPLAERHRTSEVYWKKPLKWNKELICSTCGINQSVQKISLDSPTHGYCAFCLSFTEFHRPRVFCASMADVFETNPLVSVWRMELFKLIEQTPNLDWLLLTKRPENIVGSVWSSGAYLSLPDNVWIGTSIENQARADERMKHLTKVPAMVRFVSVEPMLEQIEIPRIEKIGWVIVGGESGSKARPFDVEWARDVKKQCAEYDVPFFMKQLGGYPDKRDRMSDLPEDLRIREFPK